MLTNLQFIHVNENTTIDQSRGVHYSQKLCKEVWKGQVRVPLSSVCEGDMDIVFPFKLRAAVVCKGYLRTRMPKWSLSHGFSAVSQRTQANHQSHVPKSDRKLVPRALKFLGSMVTNQLYYQYISFHSQGLESYRAFLISV